MGLFDSLLGGVLGGGGSGSSSETSAETDNLSQVDFGDKNISVNNRLADPGTSFMANLFASLNVAPAQYGGYPTYELETTTRPRATTLTGPSALGGVSSPTGTSVLSSAVTDPTALIVLAGIAVAGGVLLFTLARR